MSTNNGTDLPPIDENSNPGNDFTPSIKANDVSDDEVIEEPTANEEVAEFTGALVFGEGTGDDYDFEWPEQSTLSQLNEGVKLAAINYKTI